MVTYIVHDMINEIEFTPNEQTQYINTFSEMFDLYGSITGGGIWPEPYTFDEKKSKSSFFWAQDQFLCKSMPTYMHLSFFALICFFGLFLEYDGLRVLDLGSFPMLSEFLLLVFTYSYQAFWMHFIISENMPNPLVLRASRHARKTEIILMP